VILLSDGKEIVEVIKKHDDWRISVQISNDNSKDVSKLTVKVRGDGTTEEALKESYDAYEKYSKKLSS
jgi:hypothetical protein